MDAFEIQKEVLSWLTNVPPGAVVAIWERGVITGLMNNALKPNQDERRHKALAWIFRDVLNKPSEVYVSSKELSDDMWWALARWTDIYHDEDHKKWMGHGGFEEEIRKCWLEMESWEAEMNQQLGFPDML